MTDTKIDVFYCPEFSIDGGFATVGKSAVLARDLRERPIPGVELRPPAPIEIDAITRVHDPGYVDAVLAGRRGQFTEHGDAFVESVLASTAGVVRAVESAMASGGAAGSLSSGLHHARFDSDSGYCTFNGLVVAALRARELGAHRVVVIDFDAHCGGGTASLIGRLREQGVDGIEQVDVSVSSFDNYPRRPWAHCVVVSGDGYLAAIDEALDSIVDPATIDVVIYNAGMDPHERAGGVAGVDERVIRERESRVFSWAAGNGSPIAWVLAGGYPSGGFDVTAVANLHRITIEEAARVATSQPKSTTTAASATD